VACLMDSKVDRPWEREDIAKEDILYLRVHKMRRQHGIIGPSAFEAKGAPGEKGRDLSTDWCKHATPEETRGRAKEPSDNLVVALTVADVESIDRLVVNHSPDMARGNRAHAEILGVNGHLDIQTQLRNKCKVVLDLGE
jgi:hypothetical protein